ncbi:putative cation transport-related protein [Chytriomyces cf. hyalinus JEL632]|nr:putative cation transport-related protein [Chytriomyces cf. hyalinus JEL632]
MSITCTLGDILEILLALVFPPAAVLVKEGCGWDFVLNIILCCIFYLPGLIHALLVLQNHQRRAVHYTVV